MEGVTESSSPVIDMADVADPLQSGKSPISEEVRDITATIEDGFQMVTNRKHRVRAPTPGSIKSPWNGSTGRTSGKLSLDERSFPTLSRPSPK
ncbi:unnamed protein product [Linum trigynum]